LLLHHSFLGLDGRCDHAFEGLLLLRVVLQVVHVHDRNDVANDG
jgi:hypothetical protein